MTILTPLQEGGDLSVEKHYEYTPDSINPVIASAEFVLKVSANGTCFSSTRCHHRIELSDCRSRSNQRRRCGSGGPICKPTALSLTLMSSPYLRWSNER